MYGTSVTGEADHKLLIAMYKKKYVRTNSTPITYDVAVEKVWLEMGIQAGQIPDSC